MHCLSFELKIKVAFASDPYNNCRMIVTWKAPMDLVYSLQKL